MEILARASVAELEAPKKSARNWNFSQWLFGTDDWIRASWEKHMKRKAWLRALCLRALCRD